MERISSHILEKKVQAKDLKRKEEKETFQ